MVEKNELQKREMNLPAAPDFIPEGKKGLEHITTQDMILPRLAIAQALSPEMIKKNEKYIAGLELGDMFNNFTGKIYGSGPLSFSVVKAARPRGVEFIPRDQGGGVRDMNVALDDPRMQWGKEGKKPIATKFYDFVILLHPFESLEDSMLALSFKSTGLKVARRLNSLMLYRNRPIFSGVYSISSIVTENQKGTFGVFEVENAGWVDNKEDYQTFEKIYESLKEQDFEVYGREDQDLEDNNGGEDEKGVDEDGKEIPF